MPDKIIDLLMEVRNLHVSGKYYEVLEIVDQIFESSATKEEKTKAMILKSFSYYFLGSHESRDEHSENGLELSRMAAQEGENLKKPILTFDALFVKAFILRSCFKHKEVIDNIEECQAKLEEIKQKHSEIYNEKKAMFDLIQILHFFSKDAYINDFTEDYQNSIDLLKKLVESSANLRYDKSLLPTREFPTILLNELGRLYLITDDYVSAEKCFAEALEIVKREENNYWQARLNSNIAETYWKRSIFDKQLEYEIKHLEIYEKIGDARTIALAHDQMGFYYSEIGEYKQALNSFQRSYNTLSEGGETKGLAQATNNIGACHSRMGNIHEAIEWFERAHELNMKIKRFKGAFSNLSNVANIYKEIGKLDEAYEIFEKVLEYSREKELKGLTSSMLWQIGSIYEKKSLYNKAKNCSDEALKITYEIGAKGGGVLILYQSVIWASRNNKPEVAAQYFKQLKDVIEELPYRVHKSMIFIAEAVILKNSPVSKDRIRAVVILEQLLHEDLEFTVHLEAILQLCELLLSELRITSDKVVLDKLQKNLNKLIELSTKNNVTHIIIESLWFKSQLALLDMNFEKTRELLNQALNIAEDKGFNQLALKMSKSREDLIKQIIKLEELEKTSPTFSKRMEIINIDEGFSEMRSTEIFQFKQNI